MFSYVQFILKQNIKIRKKSNISARILIGLISLQRNCECIINYSRNTEDTLVQYLTCLGSSSEIGKLQGIILYLLFAPIKKKKFCHGFHR